MKRFNRHTLSQCLLTGFCFFMLYLDSISIFFPLFIDAFIIQKFDLLAALSSLLVTKDSNTKLKGNSDRNMVTYFKEQWRSMVLVSKGESGGRCSVECWVSQTMVGNDRGKVLGYDLDCNDSLWQECNKMRFTFLFLRSICLELMNAW